MSGGTAPISTAFATRLVPCRPMNRATSPPPVRVADQRRAFQIERREKFGQIIRISVHFISIPRLARAAVAAAIMRDAAIAIRGQEKHLRFPGIRAQRPAVAENHRSPGCPSLYNKSRCHPSF